MGRSGGLLQGSELHTDRGRLAAALRGGVVVQLKYGTV